LQSVLRDHKEGAIRDGAECNGKETCTDISLSILDEDEQFTPVSVA
jgi:hypothetical protein